MLGRQMKKVRTTLTIDEDVLRAVKVRAARSGKVTAKSLKKRFAGSSDSIWSRGSGRAAI